MYRPIRGSIHISGLRHMRTMRSVPHPTGPEQSGRESLDMMVATRMLRARRDVLAIQRSAGRFR
jgi:hypothetical protein